MLIFFYDIFIGGWGKFCSFVGKAVFRCTLFYNQQNILIMKLKMMIAVCMVAFVGFFAQTQTQSAQTTQPKAKTEIKVPVNTGDNVAYVKAVINYIKAKFEACESIQDLAALKTDPLFKNIDESMEKTEESLTPEQKAELQEWMKLPENNIEAVIEAKVKQLMPKE